MPCTTAAAAGTHHTGGPQINHRDSAAHAIHSISGVQDAAAQRRGLRQGGDMLCTAILGRSYK
eukprot:16813-Heterococcus_DN1.PRE.3